MQQNMEKQISKAVEVLKKGGVIIYPTDTIWGIGCDATNPKAVEKVFEIKRRSDSKSLIVLASDTGMINQYVQQIPEIAYQLIELNDKPMTIIYPNAAGLAENVVAEDGSIGIRIPMNDFCIKLIRAFKKPIVSTSANISGENAPQNYGEIAKEILDAADFVADPELEGKSTHKASQILKVGLGGEIEVIRK
ncbi:MAG: threonylcarbamoyl-AMP synthase [Bacteroidetes bacterium]|uniref:L-threonylcarbamoyladenylate synthase n=1 Tax=Candidatus Egerieousia excrementavium TaxID=2840778 RepID=A0A9D9DKD8_9BACT|nr:threonylcarbamoyl-AMP synthase [Candidatus Egerieousia excrementavium]